MSMCGLLMEWTGRVVSYRCMLRAVSLLNRCRGVKEKGILPCEVGGDRKSDLYVRGDEERRPNQRKERKEKVEDALVLLNVTPSVDRSILPAFLPLLPHLRPLG